MMTKNQRLKDQLAKNKAEKRFEKSLAKLNKAEAKAQHLEKEFRDAYTDYTLKLKSHRKPRSS